MDPSISTSFDPVRYILKGEAIRAGNLSPVDWAYILEDVVARLKPILQYMEGFRIISRPSDVWPTHSSLFNKGVHFDDGVSLATPYMRPMANLTFSVPASPMPFLWRTVLLVRDGTWAMATYMRNSNQSQARWSFMTDAELLNLLGDDTVDPGRIGHAILEGLADMVGTTVQERERRLSSIRGREMWLNDVLGRVQRH